MNKRIIQTFAILCSSLTAIVVFQNCAVQNQFESTDLASTSSAANGMSDAHLSHDGGNHVAPEIQKPDINSSPMVLDRFAVVALFTDVFGPGAETITVIKQIANDSNVFGGSCNFLSQQTRYAGSLAARDMSLIKAGCANSYEKLGVKPHVGINSLRQGRINEACNRLVLRTDTMNYVMTRIGARLGTAVVEASDTNTRKLFNLFYRARPAPQQALLDSLKLNVGSPASREGWQRAVYATCVSGYWQVL